jgi:hypothetical protein
MENKKLPSGEVHRGVKLPGGSRNFGDSTSSVPHDHPISVPQRLTGPPWMNMPECTILHASTDPGLARRGSCSPSRRRNGNCQHGGEQARSAHSRPHRTSTRNVPVLCHRVTRLSMQSDRVDHEVVLRSIRSLRSARQSSHVHPIPASSLARSWDISFRRFVKNCHGAPG